MLATIVYSSWYEQIWAKVCAGDRTEKAIPNSIHLRKTALDALVDKSLPN